MKKALIWKEDYQGRVAGQIERIGSAESIDSWNHYLKEKMEIVEVPVELESLEQYEIKSELVDGLYVLSQDDEVLKQKKMSELRSLRDVAIKEADVEINKHIDGDTSAQGTEAAYKAYRVALRDVTEQFKGVDGGIENSILNADLQAILPAKP